jgi:hypothetical protein
MNIGETFTTYSAAQTRSCNNQHNACADIANDKTVCVVHLLFLHLSQYLVKEFGGRGEKRKRKRKRKRRESADA